MNVENTTEKIECLLNECKDLGLSVKLHSLILEEGKAIFIGSKRENIVIRFAHSSKSLIEQTLSQMDVDFEKLPLLVRGDSKEIRLLTPKIALAKLIPSVYSYTYNRYGEALGTDEVRTLFSAALFRKLANEPGPYNISSAFLGVVKSKSGLLLAEKVVQSCNIEVRVKRFHIGSPLHRYLYADNHSTRNDGAPLQRWSRFPEPIVCFDWRHPLIDENGKRLADEPLPDDYAALWLDDAIAAKQLAKNTFLWIEELFARSGLQLVDICFFIDRTSKIIYGEISPDCMRVRNGVSNAAESLDKDIWRSGGTSEEVLSKYQQLHEIVFGEHPSVLN